MQMGGESIGPEGSFEDHGLEHGCTLDVHCLTACAEELLDDLLAGNPHLTREKLQQGENGPQCDEHGTVVGWHFNDLNIRELPESFM